jgi:hypothetical protein
MRGRMLEKPTATAPRSGRRPSDSCGADSEHTHFTLARDACERPVGGAERAALTFGQGEIDAVGHLVTQLEREDESGVDELLVLDQLDRSLADGMQQGPEARTLRLRVDLS